MAVFRCFIQLRTISHIGLYASSVPSTGKYQGPYSGRNNHRTRSVGMIANHQALIQKLLADEIWYAQLTAEQKEFIRSVEHKCPGCDTMFPLYDARQGVIRKVCSRACLGKVRRTRHWECALCSRRFKNPLSLEKHIKVVHKDYTLHQYLLAYLKKTKGKSPSLTPFCPHCGRDRKLNLVTQGYDNCRCQNALIKIQRLKKLLAETRGEAERAHILRQINGCNGLLMRRQKTPAGISKRSAKATQPPAPVPLAPIPTPVSSIIKVAKGFDLSGFASYFEGLLSASEWIFDSFYRVAGHIQSGNRSLALNENALLLGMLQQQQWTQTMPTAPGYWLFVYAFPADEEAFTPDHLARYFKTIPCDRVRVDESFSKIRCKQDALIECLRQHQDLLKYPLPEQEAYQAWFRIGKSDGHGKAVMVINPVVLHMVARFSRVSVT